MKYLALVLVVSLFGVIAYQEHRVHGLQWEAFNLGQQLASETYTTCPANDDSKKVFPEYFKACRSLCRTLYSDQALCVSSINGGSVTCVCEQTENK